MRTSLAGNQGTFSIIIMKAAGQLVRQVTRTAAAAAPHCFLCVWDCSFESINTDCKISESWPGEARAYRWLLSRLGEKEKDLSKTESAEG